MTAELRSTQNTTSTATTQPAPVTDRRVSASRSMPLEEIHRRTLARAYPEGSLMIARPSRIADIAYSFRFTDLNLRDESTGTRLDFEDFCELDHAIQGALLKAATDPMVAVQEERLKRIIQGALAMIRQDLAGRGIDPALFQHGFNF